MKLPDRVRGTRLQREDDKIKLVVADEVLNRIHRETGHKLYGMCAGQVVVHIISDLILRYYPETSEWR